MNLLAEAGPIDTVAKAVGFRSARHFTTTFPRVVGVTPYRYRTLGEAAPRRIAGDVGAHVSDVNRHDISSGP